MKRLLSLILAIVMLTGFAGAIPVSAETVAEGSCGESLTWVLDSEGTLTITGTGEMTDWGTSSSVPWKSYNSSIKEVVFPSTITAIYSWSFFYCSGLKTVTIPPSVEFIDWFAFPSLDSITGYKYSAAYNYAVDEDIEFISLGDLPEAVVSEGSCGETVTYSLTNRGVMTISGTGEISAYEYEESPWSKYMYNVKEVVIEEGVTAIGDGAFSGNLNIESVSIPEGVTYIGSMAFYGCNYIEELNLPSTLLTVGDSAFNSTGMTELVIPDGVTYIGDEAFGGAPTAWVIIPDSVTYIGYEAFGDGYTECVIMGTKGSYAESWASENGYSFKAEVAAVNGTIGDSITWELDTAGVLTITGTGRIESWGGDVYSPWYDYRDNIVEVIIGDGITYLGGYSFWDNTALESVTIPESVEYVDFYFIWNESNVITIIGATYSEAYTYAQNRGYNFLSTGYAAKKVIATGSCGDSATYTIDNYGTLTITGTGGITKYSDWYDYRYDITEVVIENGITSICSDAFTMCDNMTSITIPVSVSKIDTWAFSGIQATVKGYDPSEAKTFAEKNGYEFESLGEAPLTVLASGKCGESATWSFDNYSLLKIEGSGAMDFTLTESGNVAGGAVLMSSSSDVPWYDYKSKIKNVEIAEGITTIADYAFSSCESLKEVNLPSTVVSLGYQAFAWNDALEKVTIHYNTLTFGEYAFHSTANAVIYGYTGSMAESYANENGKEFVSIGKAPVVTVAEGDVTETITWTLDSYGLLNITGTGDMPDYAYSSSRPWENYKNSIKSVEINGVDYVGAYSFVRYSALTAVELKGVKAIANYAFYDCSGVTEVVLPATLTDAKKYSFNNMYSFTVKGYEGSYAQLYADYKGYPFEALEGKLEIKTVYVSSIEELIAAIGSNTEIIIEDGVYLLDRSSYLGDLEYTWEYADVIRIENVINLTIKARNPGKVEILALQADYLSYSNQYYNAPFYIKGAYNLVIEGIRFGNMDVISNNGSRPQPDDVTLMGGYDEYSLNGYSGAYVADGNAADYNSVPITSKVIFRDCDIFNCTYAITFYGTRLVVDNCTIRDNVKGAIESNTDDVAINNSVFSRNGNSESYRGTYCLNTGANVTNCTFINNGNEAYASGTITGEGTVFSNNNWDSETPKAYGITKNGITWSVDSTNTLKLGYSVNADKLTIESKTGEVYPYTVASLPWKDYDIASVDAAEGVTYNYIPNGPCGETAVWSYDESTKTLTISGKGDMSDMGYIALWSGAESIVIADTITGVYNLFTGTAYFGNEANWENDMLYIGDVLVRVRDTAEGKVTVKEGTRVIAEEAFYNNRSITEVVIPDTVTSMGVTEKLNVGEYTQNGVFAYCTALEKLTIPAFVTEFDHALVWDCDSLREIYYTGTMAQWEKITVGKNNDQLDFCTIYAADGTITPDILYYTVDEGGVHITGVYPFATEVVIPYEIDGVKVVSVDDSVFAEHQYVTSVTIEADVESAPCFTNCKSLEKVVLGESIKYVPFGTFEGCEKLKDISLGDFVEEMSGRDLEGTAFYNDESNWENGILYVDGYAAVLSPAAEGKITVRSYAIATCCDLFNNNDKVTQIVIPDGVRVQNLGEAFYNMPALESITLPNTFTMPSYGFGVMDCEKLAKVYISESHSSLTDVDGVVFSSDMSTLVYMPMGRIGKYEIPEGVTEIGANSFTDTHLSALTIPGSVENISNGAFPYSNYLKDIYYNITNEKWDDGSIYIGGGNNAFLSANMHLLDSELVAEELDYYLVTDGNYYIVTGCRDYLTEVTIPATYEGLPVKVVDSSAFINKPMLTAIKVASENEYLASVDGVLFTKDMSALLAYPAGKTDESYTIPEGVKTIGAFAFAYNESLKTIDLGDELINIGQWAFEGSGITTITLPETMTAIQTGVFFCDSLESVYFGPHITSIERNAFSENVKYIYFDGSKGDWYNINGQHYVPGTINVVTKVEVNAVAFKDEERVGIELIVEDIEYGLPAMSMVIIGVDKDGAQLSFNEMSNEEIYSGYTEITSEEADIDKIKTVKIFVWESLESMRPIGDPIEVEIR